MVQVVLCAYTVTSTHSSLQVKQGLPLFNQLVSWLTLGSLPKNESFERIIYSPLFFSNLYEYDQ